jgi:hypothetical protein
MERVKRRIFAGLSAVALTAGAIAAAAPTVSAATTQCGSNCMTWAAQEYGSADVAAIQARLVEQGSLVTLAGSGLYSGEDFKALDEGTTTFLWEYGIVPTAIAKNWPSQQMYEYEYDPFGQESNLCIGTATDAANGTELSLQPCGVNDQTLWLPDTHATVNGYEPIIAGSDTRSTGPWVITAASPGGALTTRELASPAPPSQLWKELAGVL